MLYAVIWVVDQWYELQYCSINWAVRRSLRGRRWFFKGFSSSTSNTCCLAEQPITIQNAFTPEMTIHDKCHGAVSQCPEAGTRKQKEKPCEVVCGLTSFCNIETMLRQNNGGSHMQMGLRGKLSCYWSRRYGAAVKTPTADVSLFTWTLFIVQQLLGAAALFMDSSCPSTNAAQCLHAKRHFLLVCACAFMDCKCRKCNGIRWRWSSEVSVSWLTGHVLPAGLLTNNTGVVQVILCSFVFLKMVVFLFLYKEIINHIYMALVDLMRID